jgi:hypothetical protein
MALCFNGEVLLMRPLEQPGQRSVVSYNAGIGIPKGATRQQR